MQVSRPSEPSRFKTGLNSREGPGQFKQRSILQVLHLPPHGVSDLWLGRMVSQPAIRQHRQRINIPARLPAPNLPPNRSAALTFANSAPTPVTTPSHALSTTAAASASSEPSWQTTVRPASGDAQT